MRRILAWLRRGAMTSQVIDAIHAGRNHWLQRGRTACRVTTKEILMSVFASPRFLPAVMWADAASCAATGALQVAFTGALAGLTGLPAPLLMGTGVFLLVYAAAAAFMASRSTPPRTLIGLVVAGNFGWAVACIALLVSGMFAVTALGMAWVLAQVACVVVLAELQWTGLRRTRGSAGAVTGLTPAGRW
jgi:hypothetical protein